jgi:hypothetical protein
MVGTDSCRVPLTPHYSGYYSGSHVNFAHGSVTLCGRSFQSVKLISRSPFIVVPLPRGDKSSRFRLFRFRSPLLTESLSFSLPEVTEMFHFTSFRFPTLFIHVGMTVFYYCRIAPFGHPRISTCLQLPAAFRSLPRPSSPPGS